jgi:hypothetical protein
MTVVDDVTGAEVVAAPMPVPVLADEPTLLFDVAPPCVLELVEAALRLLVPPASPRVLPPQPATRTQPATPSHVANPDAFALHVMTDPPMVLR